MAEKEEEVCFKKTKKDAKLRIRRIEETVSKLLCSFFKEDKTRLGSDATQLMREMLKVFVQEAALRSLKQAESEDCDQIETEHFEKILPQLLLDF